MGRIRVLFDSIHVSQFFKSFPLDSSDSSCLKKSLISSSHLFLGLPTDLFVLTLLMRPGSIRLPFLTIVLRLKMQFTSHFSISSFCVLRSNKELLLTSFALRLLLCFSWNNWSILPHRFQFFHVFFRIFHEGNTTVLIPICIGCFSFFNFFSIFSMVFVLQSELSSSVFGPSSLLFSFCAFLSVFSLCLNDETEHLSLRWFDHPFLLFRECPCSRGTCQCWRYHNVEKSQFVA